MRPMAEGKAFPGMRILPPRADHRKASLSSAERAELQAARDVPELAPEANVARQAQMAADGGVSERIGWSKGGLQHAIARGHVRETGLTTDEFARAAEDIANSPIGTMANPGGGTRAYGLIHGPYFETQGDEGRHRAKWRHHNCVCRQRGDTHLDSTNSARDSSFDGTYRSVRQDRGL